MTRWGEIKCANCATLEERLEAALQDAKEAEAYAEELEAKLAKSMETICWVYNMLHEINPSNYGHDDVCRMNDASVEVILGLADIVAELKGQNNGE